MQRVLHFLCLQGNAKEPRLLTPSLEPSTRLAKMKAGDDKALVTWAGETGQDARRSSDLC